jgi:hypothetical protein
MKLLSVNLARTILLGPMSDLNPRGASTDSILFPFLVNTYKFKKVPSLTEIPDLSKGIKFELGDFDIGGDYPIVVNLTFYNDGVIADSGSSTNDTDAFLEDMYTKFSELFKMPLGESIIKRRAYLSQLFVSTDKSLELINPKLKLISKYLSESVEEGNNVFQLGGISFWSDQITKVPPPPFTFERAVGVPFSDNRYYSAAPLPTDKHLELLDKLENIFSEV